MKKIIPTLITAALFLSACAPTTPEETQSLKYDLDGDGLVDSIHFKIQNSTTEPQLYTLTVNEVSMTLQGDNLAGYFGIVDFDKGDNRKQIAVSSYGPSDDYSTEFFSYADKNLVDIGSISGLYQDMHFDGNGMVTTQSRGAILQTWFFEDSYQLSSGGMLTHVDKDLYEMNTPVTVKQSITLQSSQTDSTPAYTLEEGATATVVASDNKEWCLVKNAEGQEGWFAVENFDELKGTGLRASDFFDGFSYAD